MFNRKNPKIEYWTDVESLTEIEEACPILYKNLKPSWWKNVPSDSPIRTVKNCPSFSDLFSNAYVLRMWCDSRIIRERDGFRWETPTNKFFWQGHQREQLTQHVPQWMGNKVWATPKAISPWYAKTPKGYSIYQMPVMYDASSDFCSLEGIIHTDKYHSLNIPMIVFSEKDEFEIKLGTPLALHIPFKREKFSLEVRESTKEDQYLQNKTELVATSKFKNSYRNYLKDMYKNT